MRTLLLVGWLMVPIAALAYHYGPGQERSRLDEVAKLLAQGEKYGVSEAWEEAAQAYDDALKLLPVDRVSETRRIRLERDKALMLCHKLPEAHQDLQGLVEEMEDDAKADAKVLAGARSALANSQYYMTWLMRLEGSAKDQWEPEIEAARQTYRLLAEHAEAKGDTDAAAKYREDLESTIRLARMNLDELQGLSLPCQCCCKSGKCNGKKPGKSQNKAKEKDGRGASSGPPPDSGGH